MKNCKSCLIALVLILTFSAPAISEITLSGGVKLDWPLINQQERDKTINYYHNLLFQNVPNTISKDLFADNKKDKDRDVNKSLLKDNMLSLPDRTLAGFYIFDKILYLYAIKYENNKKNIYYYDALGNLIYYDILEKPYDEYPYKAYQYKNNGRLIGVTYYLSEDDQFAFKANGEFYCRWYQDKCYDRKAKMVITRKLQD